MSSPMAPRCQAHPAEPAGWSCQACGEPLCVGCCVRRKAGGGTLVACRHCGGLAQAILVRSDAGRYAALLPGALVYPFSRRGFLTLAALGIVLAPLRLVGLLPSLLALGSFCSYLFVVVRTSALGEEDVPEAEDFSHLFDLLGALGKAATALLLALVPFLLYWWKLKAPLPSGAAPDAALRHVLGDPLVYLTLLLGLAWAPMALVLAAVNSPFLSIVNPLLAARAIRRLGADFLLAALAFWALALASVLLWAVGLAFQALVPIPLVPRMLAEAVGSYFPLVGARTLGLLLFARGADLGYGQARGREEPVLGALQPPLEEAPAGQPNAQAQAARDVAFDLPLVPPAAEPPLLEGVLLDEEPAPPPTPEVPAESAPALDPSSAPTILELPRPDSAPSGDLMPEEDFLAHAHFVPRAAPPAAALARPARQSTPAPLRPPPLAAPPAPGPVASSPPAPASPPPSRPPSSPPVAGKAPPPTDAQLLSSAAAGRFDLVAAAYRARLGDVTVLDAAQLLQTADAALARRDLQTASHALKRAGLDHPASPLAPAALLRAARLLAGEMKKPADGAKLARHLVQRHPASSEAQEARALLQGTP